MLNHDRRYTRRKSADRPRAPHVLCCVAVGCVILLTARTGFAEGIYKEKALDVFNKHKDAVCTVQLVLKRQMSMGGGSSHEDESKREITGTMIGPDGLTVVALTSIDPAGMYRKMMARGDSDFQMSTDVTSCKMLLQDGEELPARVLLRDPDLDIAFVRPTDKPEANLPHVDLTDADTPEILDDLVAINRLGKVARRAYCVSIEHVEGIVEKPRTFYIPSQGSGGNATLGCPAFSMDGKIVGIPTVRAVHGDSYDHSSNMLIVLVPPDQIIEAAEQVPPFEEGESSGS